MGFLPNGDLIIVSLNFKSKVYKIYLYSFNNKPTSETPWECSQIYDIEFHKSLNKNFIDCFVYQTKLFFFNDGLITQWDLLTMTIEMQYNDVSDDEHRLYRCNIAVNKNQTLLAFYGFNDNAIHIYSMETGVHVSRYG